MADIIYAVEVQLSTKGSGNADPLAGTKGKLDGLDSQIRSIGSAFAGLGGRLESAFTGAVEAAGSLAMGLAKVGAVVVGGAAIYGVVKLNNELEKAQIGIAAIFSANGVSGNMEQGMKMSADMMAKIRKDAAALPGETSDLLAIFRSVTIPGLRAGADVDRLEKLSGNIMAAGSAAGLDMATVARESGALLGGRAGGHNILGSTLFGLTGKDAEKYNKMSGENRLKFLEDGMGKYQPAIAAFSASFDGLSSTLKDNTKKFLSTATHGLFERVKGALFEANGWFDNHQGTLDRWSNSLGTFLESAWDKGRGKLEEWTPALLSFMNTAKEQVVRIWQILEPIADKFGPMLKSALGDPATFDKIESVLKLYAGVKLGGAIVPGITSLGSGVGGLVGSGAEALGVGAVGAAALPELAVAAGVITVGLIGAAGAVDVLTDSTNQYHDSAMQAIKSTGQDVSATAKAFGEIESALMPFADIVGVYLIGNLQQLAIMIRNLTETYAGAIGEINYLTGGLFNPMRKDERVDIDRTMELHGTAMGMAMAGVAEKNDPSKNRNKVTGGGGTTVKIDKVEITVSSNQEPSRIARAVQGALSDIARHPKASRGVPNFSASRY